MLGFNTILTFHILYVTLKIVHLDIFAYKLNAWPTNSNPIRTFFFFSDCIDSWSRFAGKATKRIL